MDTATNVYRLTDQQGNITEYSAVSGVLQKRTTAGGNQIAVTAYLGNGFNYSAVQRSYVSGGVTTIEEFLYEYDNDAQKDPLLTSVTLRRKVGTGDWTNVMRVNHTYYGPGAVHGSACNLETATAQVWESNAWANTGTTYYRYYQQLGSSSSSSSSSGGCDPTAAHLLRYVMKPASYDLLAADPNVSNPLTATDAQVAQYADNYFEYSTDRRVTKELVEGGSRTFQFTSTESAFSLGLVVRVQD